MAQYGIIYRLQWNTVPSVLNNSHGVVPAQAMIVNIFDTETLIEDFQTPVVIPLLADAQPLIIKIINNDQDKFSVIRAKQAIIQFKSDSSAFQDSLTFADSSDNRWYVEATADGEFVFKGFLMITDSQQAHLPDPNLVQLIASDHLALLRDINLTTDAGINPSGKFRLGVLIAMCLKKTGLRLPIIAVNNLRHGGAISPSEVIFGTFSLQPQIRVDDPFESFFYIGQVINVTGSASNNTTFTIIQVVHSGSDTHAYVAEAIPSGESALAATLTDDSNGHIYDKVFLDALTFETEIGFCENCNQVLEKILGEDCFLTQWKGKWYIMRVDEYDGNPIYPATFDVDGRLVSIDSATSFSKSVGAAETRRLANADALRRYDRPQGSIQETLQLSYPQELPCNVDFSRGDFVADLPDETNSDGIVQQVKKYDFECWQSLSKQGGGAPNIYNNYGQAPISGTDLYIKKFFYNDEEVDREFIIEAHSGSGSGVPYVQSEKLDLNLGDKLNLSFGLSYSNIAASTGFLNSPVMVGLFADSGTQYWWQAYDSSDLAMKQVWTAIPPSSPLVHWYLGASVDDPPLTMSFESPPLPESGRVYIFLINQYGNSIVAHYTDVRLEIVSIINGSYRRYTSFYNKVSRDPVGYFNSSREKKVYIGDLLRKTLKGALLVRGGTRLLYTGSIVFAAPNALAISGYHIQDYYPGQLIKLTGTNAGDYTVVSTIYHVIGNTTDVIFEEAIVTVTESATISEYKFVLTSRWYTAAPFALGVPPDLAYFHPYGYIQSFSVWNQFRNGNRILSSTVLGLGSMWPDALDKFSITDSNPHVNSRYFMLISFEQNWKTALWSGVFIEDYRTDIGKIYSDDHDFKYLTR